MTQPDLTQPNLAQPDLPQPDLGQPATGHPNYRFDTQKVRAAYDPDAHQHALNVPIYQNASFDMQSVARGERLIFGEEDGVRYSRMANPTVEVLEQRVAQLDGGVAGIAVASGMAAVTQTLLALTNVGDSIVVSPYLYGGTAGAFKTLFPRFGVRVDTAADVSAAALEACITAETRAIFIESIANPLGLVADIEAIAAVAHAHGVPLVVDNTLATPYLVRPLEHGADVVVYSATKGICGHGNVIAGLIIESGRFDYSGFPQFAQVGLGELRDRSGNNRTVLEANSTAPLTTWLRCIGLNYLGASLGAFDAYLVLVGLETLSERLGKQQASARALVTYLQNSPYVKVVNHSSLPTSDNYEVAQRIAPRGSGSIFSFVFKGTQEQMVAFLDATRLFTYSANLGDARSLIVSATRVTHTELSSEELKTAKISNNLIRLSVGLEDVQDLIEDLEQAFKVAFA